MTIEELAKIENLSNRFINVCSDNDIFSLSELLDFYKKHKEFRRFRNVGSKLNKELIDVCEKYLYPLETPIISIENFQHNDSDKEQETPKTKPSKKDNLISHSIPLSELAILYDFSTRTYNLCKYNKLNDLDSILDYYNKNNNFLKLRNCGSKSNTLLIKLCQHFSREEKSVTKPEFNEFRRKVQVVNDKYRVDLLSEFGDLGKNYSDNNFPLLKIIEYVLVNWKSLSDRESSFIKYCINSDTFNLTEFAKTQKITRERARQIKESLARKLIAIHSPIKFIPNLFLNNYSFNYFNENNDVFILDKTANYLIQEKSKTRLPIGFTALIISVYHHNHQWLKQNKKLNTIIFDNGATHYFIKSNINLNWVEKAFFNIKRIAAKNTVVEKTIKISIRTILTKAIKEYRNDYYSILKLSEKLTKEKNDRINLIYLEFLEEVYSLVLRKTSQRILSNRGKIYFHKKDKFTKKKIQKIDFNKLQNFLWTKNPNINMGLENSYNNYRKKVWEVSIKCRNEIVKRNYKLKDKYNGCINVLEKIVSFELNHTFKNNYLILERNTRKRGYEYLIDILKKENRPLHISELVLKTKDIDSNYSFNESSIRSTCLRQDEFICFGRTSTYGLKEWESLKENVRGGTIRQIVKEYLVRCKKPMQIETITEYVNKYRNTNAKNIITNLKLDKSNSFVFYNNNNVVGLK